MRRFPETMMIAALTLSLFLPGAARAAGAKAGVAATVNGADIATEDVLRELNRVERLFLATGKALTCKQLTRLQTDVMEGMVRRELLYRQSKKKFRVTDAEIDAEISKLKEQYRSEADLSAALASTGSLARQPQSPGGKDSRGPEDHRGRFFFEGGRNG